MVEYLAKRFAEILTKGEVFELFRLLEQRYRTISRVCEKIGIERKTFYHWRNAKQINLETKAKVLKAALEEHPIDTLEFSARRTKAKTKEILEILMEMLRREIIAEEEPEKLKSLVKKAEEIIEEYSIPITEYLSHEIDGLINAAHSKGYELRVTPVAPTIPVTLEVEPKEEEPVWTSSATMVEFCAPAASATKQQFSTSHKEQELMYLIVGGGESVLQNKVL